MKKILILIFLLHTIISGAAGLPKGIIKKISRNLCSVTTFKTDGSIIGTTTGIITGPAGRLVTLWQPFQGAARAIAIDAQGKEHEINTLLGANELYDLCALTLKDYPSVERLDLPKDTLRSIPNALYLIPYTVGKPVSQPVTANGHETFMGQYDYLNLESETEDTYNGSPVVDMNGRIVGIVGKSIITGKSHTTDLRLGLAFEPTGLTINDPTIRQTGIRIALPKGYDDAVLALLLASTRGDSLQYDATINDFISAFPDKEDGYMAKADVAMKAQEYGKVDDIMGLALRNTKAQDVIRYRHANHIYSAMTADSLNASRHWSVRQAQEEVEKAIAINPQPLYRRLLGQILYAKGEYQAACDTFMNLTKTNMKSGDLFYFAAQSRQQMGADRQAVLALLDSAVAVTPANQPNRYLLIRGQYLDEMGEPRRALADYNRYDSLMMGRAAADFYVLRHQVEMKLKQYAQALNDIAHAIVLDRTNQTYYALMAQLQLRVGKIEDAVTTSQLGLRINDNHADLHLIRGIALSRLNKMAEAKEDFDRATALGDPRGEAFSKTYLKP